MQHIRSSIKIQHNDYQFKIKSSIASQKHKNKFNFALVTTRYDMEKPFFYIVAKGSKAIKERLITIYECNLWMQENHHKWE
jgi:hypothetical protein